MIFLQENTLFYKLFFLCILLLFSFLLFLKGRNKNELFFKKYEKKKFLSLLFLSLSFLSLFTVFLRPTSTFFSAPTLQDSSYVVFLLDVSKSMLTEDISWKGWKIARLDAAKQFIEYTISQNPNNNYALTIFSWEAVRVLPFTTDINLFSTFLSWVSEKSLSKNGTDVWLWIERSVDNFLPLDSVWTIVVLTDGWEENIKANFSSILFKTKKKINFLTLWVWTEKGWYIPTWVDVFWNIQYKLYKWEKVLTTLNKSIISKLWTDLGWKVGYIEEVNSFSDNEKLLKEELQYIYLKNTEKNQSLQYIFIVLWFVFFSFYFWFTISNRKNVW